MSKNKPHRPPGKRDPYIPVEEMRKLVQQMASFGITQEAIARCILHPGTGKPITTKTLRRAFREELTTGKTRMINNVATSLYNRAINQRSPQGATAAIFILKTQAGWKDRVDVHHTGLVDNFAERLAKALSTKKYGSAGNKT